MNKTVVPIIQGHLDILATRINAAIARTKDGLVETAILLAEAQDECVDCTFKSYVLDKLDISYNRALILAKCGHDTNPTKAIADLREYNRQAVVKNREKTSLRKDVDDDEEDEIELEDDIEDTDPKSYRTSFLLRANICMEEASKCAEMFKKIKQFSQRIRNKEELLNAARDVEKAWGLLIETMERELDL